VPETLQGQFLVAMPGMDDPRFHRAVIMVLEHEPQGAMGLIINRRLDDLTFSDLMQQVKAVKADEEYDEDSLPDLPIYFGGPMEVGRGFILHTPDVMLSHSRILHAQELALTTSVDMLEAMAEERGPRLALLALGFAGWDAGQLETELQENAWLHVPFDSNLIFEVPTEECWEAALASVGITTTNLSISSGRA
jgi:putative transcriptional regulator